MANATTSPALDPDFDLGSYDYDLPAELIAQVPAEPRDSARLLVLDRASGAIAHRRVSDLPQLLRAGDLLVANHSRVLPCRLWGHKEDGGGRVELLLLHPVGEQTWQALAKGHRLRAGQHVVLPESVVAVLGEANDGPRLVTFPPGVSVPGFL